MAVATLAISTASSLTLASPASAAAIGVTSVSTSGAPASDSNGYSWVSYFRHLAGLGSVSRNPGFEAQEAVHVRYLANHSLGCETNVHDELTNRAAGCGANPYATPGGKAAANNSDVTRVSAPVSDRAAVSNWFGAAFHALTLLDPRLTSTGYSAYYTPTPHGAGSLAWPFTAAVDVYRGRAGSYHGSIIAFPANHATTPLLSYAIGTESPEPFATATNTCHSWASKSLVSAPVIIQWPLHTPTPTTGTLRDLSTAQNLPTCTLNQNSYPTGSLARQFLAGANGITHSAFYYAATPFTAGHTYRLTVNTRTITTFTAGALPSTMATSVTPATAAARLSWSTAHPGIGTVTTYHARLYTNPTCTGGATRAIDTTPTSRTALFTRLTHHHTYYLKVAARNTSGAYRWSPCRAVKTR
ncbi:fibronectin type III domain-containing protein [Jatrophihabitans telluris]|uniref:Fibronectin type III domain-containing protein n=1 Tax=Jatrophihabitans telluris TaxID=2038343 RepID=A0ABY4QZ48_9ACTN|nr:fibronectin type III domain-containing protein [Jatrophihabitans telluris]UQX88603.1 fibronectin type III domain-containing protein [Jatrophihabitans telluris]